ncbi:MAG: hypothetical protein AB8G05_01320 [Oligoflexales bacterium]
MHRYLLIIIALALSCSKSGNKNTVNKINGTKKANAAAGNSTIKQGNSDAPEIDKGSEKDTLKGKEASKENPDPGKNDNGGSEQELSITNGIKLYAQFCESCHNKIDKSAKKGATPDRIRTGLKTPQMSNINISESQISDISNALTNIEDDNADMSVTARSNYTEWSTYNKNQIDSWINADKQNANPTTRYIYLDEDIFLHPTNRNMARVCLSKAINSVSLSNPGLIHPRDVSDNHGVVFAIDLMDHFSELADLRPDRANDQDNENFRKPHRPENYISETLWTNLISQSDSNSLKASLFVKNMFSPDSYKYLIDHPLSDKSDKSNNFIFLGINDKNPDIRMAVEDAIIFGIRYIETYDYQVQANDGNTYTRQYWRSGDPVYGVDASTQEGLERFNNQCGARDVPSVDNSIVRTLTWDENGGEVAKLNGAGLPLFLDNCGNGKGFTTGSESWRNLPNGLIAYYLWGAANTIETKGATSLIYNPINRETANMNLPLGDCFYCHNSGTMYRTSDMATAKSKGLLTNQDAFNFWSSQEEVDAMYKKSSDLYDSAISEIVSNMSDDLELNKQLIDYQTQEPCFITSGYSYGTLPNGEPDNSPADQK